MSLNMGDIASIYGHFDFGETDDWQVDFVNRTIILHMRRVGLKKGDLYGFNSWQYGSC